MSKSGSRNEYNYIDIMPSSVTMCVYVQGHKGASGGLLLPGAVRQGNAAQAEPILAGQWRSSEVSGFES